MTRFLLVLLLVSAAYCQLSVDAGSPTDTFFSGGSPYTIITPSATGDLTCRYGAFSYSLPAAAPGPYLLTLTFRETGTIIAAGQRVFTVKVNDATFLDSFDLYAVAGLTPTSRSVLVWPLNGQVSVAFTYAKRSAIVSALNLAPFSTGSPPILHEKSWTTIFTGSSTIILPDTPLPNTTVKVFWGSQYQPIAQSAYTVSGSAVTLIGWRASSVGSPVTFVYFY